MMFKSLSKIFKSPQADTDLPVSTVDVVAIDPGFRSIITDEDGSSRVVATHVISYKICRKTGKRSVDYKCSDKINHGSHSGLEKQKNLWLVGSNNLYFTKEAEIFDWDIFAAAGVDALMHRLRTNSELSTLIEENPTVRDAVDQLEVVIRLCKNA